MDKIRADIIIATVAAFLTWFFNRLTIVAEIKKVKKDRINESRIPLYTECYELLEMNNADNNVVYNSEYIKKIIAIRPKMKIISSNKVWRAFKIYCDWAINLNVEFTAFCHEKDPYSRTVTVFDDEGNAHEIAAFNENDVEIYDFLIEKYIVDKHIESKTVESKIQSILAAMRYDLGNDAITG